MKTTVEDVMAPGLAVIEGDMTVRETRRLMRVRNVLALPVIDTYYAPLGIVTSTDLLKRYPPGTRISRIMTRDLVTVRRQADVATAARLMRRHQVHHLVVVQTGKVVGIVSSFDLLRLLEQGPRPAVRRRK